MSAPAPWVSDLRPVLDSLTPALGLGVSAPAVDLAESPVKLEKAGEAREAQVFAAMTSLRTGLDTLKAGGCAIGSDIDTAAHELAALRLTDEGSDSKALGTAAKTLLEELSDWRMLVRLTRHVKNYSTPKYEINFLVATLPDYVDSSSGWLADQHLAAIQSGMTRAKYSFDRVRLIDWSRTSPATAPASRLHERQPGVIVFRRINEKKAHSSRSCSWFWRRPQPAFIRRRSETASRSSAGGTTASASGASCACSARPSPVDGVARVCTGAPAFRDRSGTAGGHWLGKCGRQRGHDGKSQRRHRVPATVQPTSVLKRKMADYLEAMNQSWKTGNNVALLSESNTAYGRDALAPEVGVTCNESTAEAFCNAKVFVFPLHVAQLRSDAPVLLQPGAGLMPTAAVPLSLREPAPPTDLIPALRPQLTSPVVEATVDSILDAIRHEKLTAVGIFATDDRDVLFLAREVKRASPDVQLFLFGAHGLYLHADYVPYLRGAIVASSYSLSLANQPEIGKASERNRREPFQSMGAEGIFHATHTLVTVSEEELRSRAEGYVDLLPYCTGEKMPGCVPVAPVSLNVIGEDGYWMLPPLEDSTKGSTAVGATSRDNPNPARRRRSRLLRP